ncbi:nucleotide-binding universal stress UspA family protein [Aeromicrobium panaciterrae]|uniref:Nucleotide-binding universal stress UspA family protein n=1 Tax=Aeromicrobium panaciterrae TaxID=363861 RepID=A0ABU1ULI2_9ACTN|nr:universal stress protein [Aeromicrobium panaciterrae]MDR7086046.1 nucleotide-binding universal stress UspA family protein [Aeromicrobium panaciterrae]
MNTEIKPVVVGIVDKQPSALAVAIRQASATESPLWVVHSVGVPAQSAEFYAGYEVIEDLRRSGQVVLDEARDYIVREAPGLTVDYILSTDEPVRAIDHSSTEARLIVLGSDDVPWYERLMRTKVSGHLALHARCPVIVVPEHAGSDTYSGDIVVTLAGDTAADGPMLFALEQASAHHASLHVLHAIEPGTAPDEADRERAKITEILAAWRVKFPDVTIFEVYGRETPEDAVLRATESASLVIVGRPHHPTPLSLSRPFASDILKRTHCPVAVVAESYQGA